MLFLRGCLKYAPQMELRAKILMETTAQQLCFSHEGISKRMGWETHQVKGADEALKENHFKEIQTKYLRGSRCAWLLKLYL